MVDTFSQQIYQTKLICVYVHLTENDSEKMLSLTKSLLWALRDIDSRVSIYGIFYVDNATTFRAAVSTFVYITAYLQLTMTGFNRNNKLYFNNSMT
ncbi:hypothetical protein evm_010256 [Chilo suppressalis]|nr:hypothetical protein evm_010256 [Chilo suppressalis]